MKKNSSNQWLFTLISIVVAAIALVAVYIAYLMLMPSDRSDNELVNVSEYNNGIIVIDPPRPMPDFRLINQLGEDIQLGDLGGKPILFSFGFTHCPDVCPATLNDMRSIHEKLGEQADTIQFLFISVDGKRDSPEALAAYFKTLRVDSFLMGMTGSEDDVRAASESYGVQFILHEPDEFGNYTVEHTAGMFLLDSNRNWIRRYTFGIETTEIAENLQEIFGD